MRLWQNVVETCAQEASAARTCHCNNSNSSGADRVGTIWKKTSNWEIQVQY
jgi:hypothetical protein